MSETPPKTKTNNQKMSFMIKHGVSLTQATEIFKVDFRKMKSVLASVPSRGKRPWDGIEYWAIADIAPHIVKPVGDLELLIRTMNADDLPPNLRKEYWAAKRQEQIYRKEEGELWETDEVLGTLSTVFKDLRTELLLLGEAVEREVSLPDRAREILRSNLDTTLGNMRERLIASFGAPDPDAAPAEPPAEVDDDEDWEVDDEDYHGL